MEHAHEERAAVETSAAVVRATSMGPLAGQILALQRTAGNAAVTRLLQRTGDYETEWRNRRREKEAEANRRAKTYVGGRHQSESFDLFYGLLREWYPAYFARMGVDFLWNTDFDQKEMLKVVPFRMRDKIWNEDIDKPMLVIGFEFTKLLAESHQVPYVVTELGKKLREIDTMVLDKQEGGKSKKRVVQVEDEQISVSSVAERDEAEKLIGTLKNEYGIELSSIKSKESMRRKYPTMEDNAELQALVRIVPWELGELRALAGAAAFYAPILGDRRASSTRSHEVQELKSAGKMSSSLMWSSGEQKHLSDPTTFAEAFRGLGTVTFHSAGTNAQKDWPGDPVRQQLGTAVHEISHVLLDYALDPFVAATPYWKTRSEKSGRRGVEAPATSYGEESPYVGEDLAESVMLHFVDPQRLKNGVPGKKKGEVGNPCPERARFVEKLVADWSKKK